MSNLNILSNFFIQYLTKKEIEWERIEKKVIKRIESSEYFEGKEDLSVYISEITRSKKPIAFQGPKKSLKITPKMIAKLYLDDSSIAVTNFFSSIGHEIGHNNDIPSWCYPSIIFSIKYKTTLKKGKLIKKVIKWTCEVYADYYSCAKWLKGDINLFIDCINYKTKGSNKNNTTKTHPSWNMRIEYIQRKIFDKELLYKIAHDAGCKKEKFLDKLIDDIYTHYCSKSPNYDVISDVLLK